MREELKIIGDIEKYISGSMEEHEKLAFEASMNTDLEVQKQLQLQKGITYAIKKFGEESLQKQLDLIHEKYFKKKKRRTIFWWFLGTLIGGIGSIIIINLNQRTNKETDLNLLVKTHTIKPISSKIASRASNDLQQNITDKGKAPIAGKVVIDPAIVENKINQVNGGKDFYHVKRKAQNAKEIIPAHLESLFSKEAEKDLNEASALTGGKAYFSDNAQNLSTIIEQVLKENVIAPADIVILFDKTQSMGDDIQNVRTNIDKIYNQAKNLGEVRICLSSFADNNFTDKDWFSSTGFTSDKKLMDEFLRKTKLLNGGDTPESLYDAICFQLDEFPFHENTNKTIIVISDAAAQKGEFTVNDKAYMLKKCKDQGVILNSILLNSK